VCVPVTVCVEALEGSLSERARGGCSAEAGSRALGHPESEPLSGSVTDGASLAVSTPPGRARRGLRRTPAGVRRANTAALPLSESTVRGAGHRMPLSGGLSARPVGFPSHGPAPLLG
jgi:hypothetical protein